MSDGESVWIVDGGNFRLRKAVPGVPLGRFGRILATWMQVPFRGIALVLTVAGNGTEATVDGAGSEASFQQS